MKRLSLIHIYQFVELSKRCFLVEHQNEIQKRDTFVKLATAGILSQFIPGLDVYKRQEHYREHMIQ